MANIAESETKRQALELANAALRTESLCCVGNSFAPSCSLTRNGRLQLGNLVRRVDAANKFTI